jgi:hypothetical protein
MNYASLIWGGLTIFVALFWLFKARKGYQGPITSGGALFGVEFGG